MDILLHCGRLGVKRDSPKHICLLDVTCWMDKQQQGQNDAAVFARMNVGQVDDV